jgi:hypothetical protein
VSVAILAQAVSARVIGGTFWCSPKLVSFLVPLLAALVLRSGPRRSVPIGIIPIKVFFQYMHSQQPEFGTIKFNHIAFATHQWQQPCSQKEARRESKLRKPFLQEMTPLFSPRSWPISWPMLNETWLHRSRILLKNSWRQLHKGCLTMLLMLRCASMHSTQIWLTKSRKSSKGDSVRHLTSSKGPHQT